MAKSAHVKVERESPKPAAPRSENLKRALEAAANAPMANKAFKFAKVGDGVVGKVVSYAKQNGRFGERYTLMLVDENGEAILIFCNAVLAGEMERHQIKLGEWIAIVYRGDAPSSKGNDTKLYSVVRAEADA